jgi:hypothetical protein
MPKQNYGNQQALMPFPTSALAAPTIPGHATDDSW